MINECFRSLGRVLQVNARGHGEGGGGSVGGK